MKKKWKAYEPNACYAFQAEFPADEILSFSALVSTFSAPKEEKKSPAGGEEH